MYRERARERVHNTRINNAHHDDGYALLPPLPHTTTKVGISAGGLGILADGVGVGAAARMLGLYVD